MYDFEYSRPSSLADAVAAMKGAADGKFLAGGQSLLPAMKLELATPASLVSLGDVPGLHGITFEGGTLAIGALTTHADVAASDVVREAIPALADLASHIGDAQVRNRGTIGGSAAHNDPAADYPAAMVALRATVVTDRREVAAEDFFRGPFETSLEDDEIIVLIRFPVPEKAAYAKFASAASKYAVVGVMVACAGGKARVAVTGAGLGVFRVPEMEAALANDFREDAIADVRVDAGGLVSDLDASAEYRAHLVTVMARRAVAACT
jgi:carbon-monoxide dehydrogenase medium subunit